MSPTPSGSVIATPTDTPLPPVTNAATETATATSPTAAPAECVGDCDQNESISVDELVRGVGIALGELPLSECPSFDWDANSTVNVDELITAVNNALLGCNE
jgi:hypothetical protein